MRHTTYLFLQIVFFCFVALSQAYGQKSGSRPQWSETLFENFAELQAPDCENVPERELEKWAMCDTDYEMVDLTGKDPRQQSEPMRMIFDWLYPTLVIAECDQILRTEWEKFNCDGGRATSKVAISEIIQISDDLLARLETLENAERDANRFEKTLPNDAMIEEFDWLKSSYESRTAHIASVNLLSSYAVAAVETGFALADSGFDLYVTVIEGDQQVFGGGSKKDVKIGSLFDGTNVVVLSPPNSEGRLAIYSEELSFGYIDNHSINN